MVRLLLIFANSLELTFCPCSSRNNVSKGSSKKHNILRQPRNHLRRSRLIMPPCILLIPWFSVSSLLQSQLIQLPEYSRKFLLGVFLLSEKCYKKIAYEKRQY